MKAKKTCLLIAGLVITAASTAMPVTVIDANFYTDLVADTSNSLAGFDLTGFVGGPASLQVRYGQWNGPQANLAIVISFNGVDLTGFTSTGAYYSNPASINIDVSGLVTSGLNSLSAYATQVSGGPATYALGEIALTYEAAPVPEPSTGALAVFGMAAIAAAVSRRRRATPAT